MILPMGGKRASKTRMRLGGKICCLCGRHLDAMLWQPPGERIAGSDRVRHSLKYTLLCIIIFLSLFLALTAVYRIIPAPSQANAATVTTEPRPRVYSQSEINQMTAGTTHPSILRTLIKCESQNTNVARSDSNRLRSYGLLQFNGTATWSEFSQLAHVSGNPMNPTDAIKVADYMISHGQLGR